MLKKVLSSKILRILLSAVLIIVAFRKVDIGHLWTEVSQVPIWFLAVMLVYTSLSMIIGGIRWCLLLFDKPKMIDFWRFIRACYSGSFYSLFFPSSVGGDLVKWLPLLEDYPQLSKTKLAASVLIDRMIGFSAFGLMAFVSVVLGKLTHFVFPDVLFYFFGAVFVGIIVFYVAVYTINFDRFLGKYVKAKKLLEVIDLLKESNKKRIVTCLLISLISEPLWILPIWFYNLAFKAGMSLLSIFVFVPVINLIVILPISFAGFGARENLFVLFFSQLGLDQNKILLVSAFAGIIGVLNALVGGVLALF